jgi:hypothetical protein
MPRIVSPEPTDLIVNLIDRELHRTTADGYQAGNLGELDTFGCGPVDSLVPLPATFPPLANTHWQRLRDKVELMTRWAEVCGRLVRRSREPGAA